MIEHCNAGDFVRRETDSHAGDARHQEAAAPVAGQLPQPPSLIFRAGELYSIHNRLDRHFDRALDGSALQMLLQLFMRQAERQPTPVKVLCHSSSAPLSTAMRWVQRLEDQGFIARGNDPSDRRRTLVKLTDEGMRRMVAVLADC